MPPRLSSKSQPQVSSRREPLAETTDASTNRQLSTAPRKTLSEHNDTKSVNPPPLVTPPEATLNQERSSSIANRQASTSQKATVDYKTSNPVANRQPSPTSSTLAAPETITSNSTTNCESSTVPDIAITTIPDASIPHHESLKPKGLPEKYLGAPRGPTASAEKRISAIVEEVRADRKRNSAVSQVSTNASVNATVNASIQPDRRKLYVGPWQLGRDLGRGATGRVRLARHRVTGHLVAMKIVSRYAAAKMQSQSLMDMGTAVLPTKRDEKQKMIPIGIEREIIMMRLLCHPNVIKLYDVWENRGEL